MGKEEEEMGKISRSISLQSESRGRNPSNDLLEFSRARARIASDLFKRHHLVDRTASCCSEFIIIIIEKLKPLDFPR